MNKSKLKKKLESNNLENLIKRCRFIGFFCVQNLAVADKIQLNKNLNKQGFKYTLIKNTALFKSLFNSIPKMKGVVSGSLAICYNINELSLKEFNKGEFYSKQFADQKASIFYKNKSIITEADAINESDLGILAYYKPAMGLEMLNEAVIGEDRFNYAFKQYIKRWAFKHPSPFDFFHTIENASGEDLGWFWKSWFFEKYKIDQAIKSVNYKNNTPEDGITIRLENLEQMY